MKLNRNKILSEIKQCIHDNNIESFIKTVYSMAKANCNNSRFESHYIEIIHFVLLPEILSNHKTKHNEILEAVLDLFWHQDTPLKKLDNDSQELLSSLLSLACNTTYKPDDEFYFFALNKSIDLTKFIHQIETKRFLIKQYLNHPDSLIQSTANEYAKLNELL
ncbi:hypothetical protein [Labilibacter marinus]|uniref:hypothetical protein n=1 Tax=Labilibacter marinus TaxID=1477105 RepID=UPI00117AC4C0|nr:hypothetical protein [Labilibacter marinus]